MTLWSSLDKADKRAVWAFLALTAWTPCGLALAAVSLVSGEHSEWPPDDMREAIGFWTAIAIFASLFCYTLWSAGTQAVRRHVRAVAATEPFSYDLNDPDGER